MVDIGVLEEDYTFGWASPTCDISKKNGTIRVVSQVQQFSSLTAAVLPLLLRLICLQKFKFNVFIVRV
jgi:hypothetical protein